MPLPLRSFAAAWLLAHTALLHHGHVHMFLTDVRERLRAGLPGGRRARVTQEGSRLLLSTGDPLAAYELTVRRATRSLDIAYDIRGSRADVDSRVTLLEEHAGAIIRRLGGRVDLERITRTHARLRESLVLSDGDWSPKRELTGVLARRTAARLVAFVRVLEPIVGQRGR